MWNKFVILVWSVVWRKWLICPYSQKKRTVIKVKGWRTAIIKTNNHVETITPCFKILWFTFD